MLSNIEKNNIFKNFKKLCTIPHCSFETEQMRDFIVNFLKENDLKTNVDKFGNIHAIKGKPKICLQSHYDMVCIGDTKNIKIIYENGHIKAENSTLGADNGIGVAMMMQAVKEFKNIECLFTNNEEVGLLGAIGFKDELKSTYLLNLDSENDKEVIIGCAGGVSIFANISSEQQQIAKQDLYEITVSGLSGGHSGVDIHKNIPNAIKLLGRILKQNNATLVQITGGERNNSIPVSAKALATSPYAITTKDKYTKIKHIGKTDTVLKNSQKILDLINSFSQGVRSYDYKLNMPISSINLSTIKLQQTHVEFEFFARSMCENELEILEFETEQLANSLGFKVTYKDKTLPWEPMQSNFAKDVLGFLQKEVKDAKITAIHAGLECGIIKDGQKNIKEVCSIGPNIYFPHSINESCEMVSVERIYKVLCEILRKYQ